MPQANQREDCAASTASRWSSRLHAAILIRRVGERTSHRFGAWLRVGPQDIKRKKLATGEATNREYYEEALAFGQRFYHQVQRQHCIGVHLLFAEGFSHPAFTTTKSASLMAASFVGQIFTRLYSVVLPGRWPWSRDVEFAFFFFFRGALESFLRSAHVMDRLVLSFRREPWRSSTRPRKADPLHASVDAPIRGGGR